MRCVRMAAVGVLMAGSWAAGASAQYHYRTDNPCLPAVRTGNTFLDLASAMGQQRRQQQCAALQQAQWADRQARQQAAKDQADAEAAKQAQQQKLAQDEADRQQTAENKREAAAEARSKRDRAAAEGRARARAAEAENQRQARLVALSQAENSRENYCKTPDLARGVMQSWNDLDTVKDAGLKVVDIEHLTTVSFDAGTQTFSCHGVFITNRGWDVVGTATVKKNVAGDPMFIWQRDENQDVADYKVSAPAGPKTAETASQMKVGGDLPRVTAITSTSTSQ